MIRGTEHFEHREAAVLVSAVPPLVPKTAANPEGLPLEVPAGLRADKDWSQFCKYFAVQFCGANGPDAKASVAGPDRGPSGPLHPSPQRTEAGQAAARVGARPNGHTGRPKWDTGE